MTLPVFLAPLGSARVGGTVVVEGDEARHAVVVRRIRVGERVVLADGAGTAATCTVAATTKTSLTATVEELATRPAPTPQVTVVQAIPKGERAELTVEVLTEVGVDVVVPWAASRSVGVWRGERAAKALAKWRSSAREAGKQSRRAWLPEVTEMATTGDVVSLMAHADLVVVLHEAADQPLAALDVSGARSMLVVVGPEGGLADDEVAAFAAAGARVVRLGDSVLRTSTAGVVAVAALLSRTSRWA